MQSFLLQGKAFAPFEIALADEVLYKAIVGRTTRKIAAGSHPQSLVHGLFEAMMRLLHIPVLVSHMQVVPGRQHAIVSHQCMIAFGPILRSLLVQPTHGS